MTSNPIPAQPWYQPIVDFVKKVWLVFTTVSTAVADIIAFIKLGEGEQELFVWVIAIGLLLILLVILIYIGWLNRESANRPLLRNSARLITIIIFLIGAVASIQIYQRNVERNAKFLILVLDFTGPDSDNYPIRQDIVQQLRDTLKPYEAETEVIGEDLQITEDEGSAKAVEIGKSYKADLVLWGRYQIQDSIARVTVHVENLANLSRNTLPLSEDYVDESPTDHFQFQDKLYKQSGAMALFISAMTRYEVKDYAEAERRLNEAIELGEWPDQLVPQTILYFYRGYSRLQNKNYQESINDFNKVVELLSESTISEAKLRTAKAYNNMGIAFEGLSQIDEAISSYQKAISSDGSFLNARHNLGITYSNLGDFDSAQAEFEKVLVIDPENLAAYNNIGVNLERQGDYQRSIDAFAKAIAIDPSYYLAYLNKGFTYEKLGQIDQAIEDYSEAIRLNSEYAKSYNNRGNLYINLKLYDLAIIDLEKAVYLDPTYEIAYRNLGRAHSCVKEYRAAIDDFTKAIEIAPGEVYSYVDRGGVYRELEQYDLALQDYGKAIELGPDDAYPYRVRGDLYAELKQYDLAIADYTKSIELDPTYVHIYYSRGLAYQALGRTTEAEADLKIYEELTGQKP